MADLTDSIRGATAEEFQVMLNQADPALRVLMRICREGGTRLIEDEMCPPGIILGLSTVTA